MEVPGALGDAGGAGAVCTGAPPSMMLEEGLRPDVYARKSEVIMKTVAATAVSLLRKLVGPLEPNSVWDEPPPKTAPISAPFPVCRRMIRIKARDTETCTMTISVCMGRLRSSVNGISRSWRTNPAKGWLRRRARRRRRGRP